MSKSHIVVVGLDLSELSLSALDQGFTQSALAENGELHVVSVVDPAGVALSVEHAIPARMLDLTSLDGLRGQLAATVQARLALAKTAPRKVVVHACFGDPSTEIARYAMALHASLVIVATHGRKGISRFILGSVAELMVRRAPCPVLVVRPMESDGVPEIEPLCPDCAAVRAETAGTANERLWCDRHSEHHPRAHTYHVTGPNTSAADPWGFDSTPE